MPRRDRFVDVLIPETGRIERIARSVAREFGLTPVSEEPPAPERVITRAQAERFRPLLDQLNAVDPPASRTTTGDKHDQTSEPTGSVDVQTGPFTGPEH